MSNTKDIVTTYLKSRELKPHGNHDVAPIMPFIIMDSAYQLYLKYVLPYPSQREMKKSKNEWGKSYKSFNSEFFSTLDNDQRDLMMDILDEFEEETKDKRDIVFFQLLRLLPTNIDVDKRKILASCMTMEVITQSAIIVWEQIYEGAYRIDRHNRFLEGCAKQIGIFKNLLYGNSHGHIDPNKDEQVTKAVDVLCSKQINFIFKTFENVGDSQC